MSHTVKELIRSLEDRDIRLEVVNDRLRVDAPQGALTPQLRQMLRDRKPELIFELKSDWARDARRVIDALPDSAVKPILREYYVQCVQDLQRWKRMQESQAEQEAFGLLLYAIARAGVDLKTYQCKA